MEKIKNITQVKTETADAETPLGNKTAINKSGLDWFWLARLMYPLTIVLIVIVLVIVMFFLYRQVYQTATQLDVVAGLKGKVIEVQVNSDHLTQIKDLLCRKTSTPAVWPFKNPFIFSLLDPPLRPLSNSWLLNAVNNNSVGTSTVSSTTVSSTAKTTSTVKINN